jgi:hypothetical protein
MNLVFALQGLFPLQNNNYSNKRMKSFTSFLAGYQQDNLQNR